MEAQDVFESDGYNLALLYENLSEKSEFKINKICFEQSPFSYVVEYIEADDVTKITCSHDEEYFCWSNVISEPIRTEKHSQNRASFDLAITPKILFTILKEYCDGKLVNTFSLKFPKEYKTVTTDLFIEINTRLPYSEDIDIKFIYLKPDSITETERFDSKLNRMRKEQDSVIKEMQSDIADLKNMLKKIMGEYVTKKELHIYNNQVFDKFATKENLKKYAIKEDPVKTNIIPANK